ncbi:hypothetical protein [Peribacillus frigoritolerans]|uniref:hypothetical protein n=1 Tax=Peribacillus frigoritolerans TaxID=450367 RepID=UPI0039A07A62
MLITKRRPFFRRNDFFPFYLLPSLKEFFVSFTAEMNMGLRFSSFISGTLFNMSSEGNGSFTALMLNKTTQALLVFKIQYGKKNSH